MGQQPTLLGGQWFERPADSLSLGFMRGVSGSCGLALPINRQCIVSHNSLQPLRHVGSDLQAVLMNSTAAAKTSATPAAVLFCLVKVECFGWLIASPKPHPLGVLEFSVGAYMRK